MNTVIVWVMLASVATSSQNRASFVVDNIASEKECRAMVTELQSLWTYERGGQRYTDARGTCVQYTKVIGPDIPAPIAKKKK